ncbi:hypothetical protein [Nonomuraea guangzhouensis]|uniref:Uncharacterized protein n=1 Tax=Nonomuraea guangzhouensis TaxID=1291555 RepID=A0ABW4GN24_9ACTN|nr:hypothetical protein [Nonomuraea guangzhouensis]
MTVTWDVVFAQLIRRERQGYWGNWSLNPAITPGAVGVLDPGTGAFTPVGMAIPGLTTTSRPISQRWSVMSEHVSRKEIDLGADGTVIDPDTGTKVNAEITVSWSLEQSGSMFSEFAVTSEEFLDLSLLRSQLEWLEATAETHNMSTGHRISQGFGVVTSVIWAKSGLNIAAQSENTTFSLSGSVGAVHDLLGQGKGQGSFATASADKSVSQHLWPETPESLAPCPAPIAYTFASFDGRTVMERWTGVLGSFELLLNSVPGCTYVVNASLTYDTVTRTALIPAGLSATFGAIPLDATNLVLDLAFKGVFSDEHHRFEWNTPLGQWAGGVRQIDLSGVWPGSTSALDVQSGNPH